MASEGIAASPAVATAGESADAAGRTDARRESPRKIIYKGEVSLETDDLDRAAEGLLKESKRFGAYIGNAERSGARGTPRTATWTIRVPSDRFDAFLKGLPTLGEFQSSSQTAEDVSEEFYDAQSRLKNKRIEEGRLVELLRRVAGNLDQILRVEKELSRIREEIETIEGRIRFLSNQTDLSTVTVTIREVKNFSPAGPPTMQTRIARAFHGSIELLGDLGTTIVLIVVGLAPWILPIGLVALLTRRIMKRRLASRRLDRDDEKPPTPPPMTPI